MASYIPALTNLPLWHIISKIFKISSTPNFIIIKIKNNGPKIEENIIDKIFQVGGSTKENKNKDNGFGLPIVKDIIEKNGGTVEVESNELFTELTIKIPKR